MRDEEQRARQREATRRYRERLRAKGLRENPRSEASKRQNAEQLRNRRIVAAELGETLPSDIWWKLNPDKHRQRTRTWRIKNTEYAKQIQRKNQAVRRSTPWGKINNRVWPLVHNGVRAATGRHTKYSIALGYTWRDLRHHLECQFTNGMTWENWGSHWELDHIIPLSSFEFQSIDDPIFKQAWALSNLRPLLRQENQKKGARQ